MQKKILFSNLLILIFCEAEKYRFFQNEGISAKASKHNKQCLRGKYNIIYKFNENVLQGEEDVVMEKSKVNLKGFKQSINLKK